MSNKQDQVLVMDDEPELLEWLVEYLSVKGMEVTFAKDIAEGMSALEEGKYCFLVLDLNVPISGECRAMLSKNGELFLNFPGLYIAQSARTKGYRDRQVIVYSVHDIDEVRAVTDRLRVTYVTKGRPRAFKAEIDDVLSFDPSEK